MFIAPLNVALSAITSNEELEMLRSILASITGSIDHAAQKFEDRAAAQTCEDDEPDEVNAPGIIVHVESKDAPF